jgi:hypothetical protein
MTRLRWAALTAACGLGLACGCQNVGNGQLMSRIRGLRGDCGCEGPVVSEGPLLGDPGMGPPPGPPAANCPVPQNGLPPLAAPQNGLPPLAPPPRLVPEAQPTPAGPTSARK